MNKELQTRQEKIRVIRGLTDVHIEEIRRKCENTAAQELHVDQYEQVENREQGAPHAFENENHNLRKGFQDDDEVILQRAQ